MALPSVIAAFAVFIDTLFRLGFNLLDSVNMSIFSQMFFIPKPPLTEKNVPSQAGKVHIVTGGYAGVGHQLAKILYGADATVYVAGRSQEKADKAIKDIKDAHPNSKGKLEYLHVDLSDLATIKPAVDSFLAKEEKLHVLTNNAGVMFPPKGSKDKHGYELQMGTNCLGPYLLTKLLMPTLSKTATSESPNTVRVTWGSSSAVDLLSPKPGGVVFDDKGAVTAFNNPAKDYGQSKAANVLLGCEGARRWNENGVIHVSWNPGNLKTELQRHTGFVATLMIRPLLYPAVMGAYTELYAAVSKDITSEQSGCYIIPWGRIAPSYRKDVQDAGKAQSEGGTGLSGRFFEWCDEQTKPFEAAKL